MQYTSSNGITFTDKDIERWANEAEQGFPNSTLEPAQPYEWEHKPTMQARTIRAPQTVWNLLDQEAAKRSLTPSEYIRQVLTRSLVDQL